MMNATFVRGQQSARSLKRLFKWSRRLHSLFSLRLTVKDGADRYIFHPRNLTEYYRAITFFTKEEGTIEWLKSTMRDGDVFYDIGANVGLYSLYAAKQAKLKVFAFEPHKYTFVNLMDNIAANGLLDSIAPVAIPLSDGCEPSTMNYAQLDSGTSMSQLGHAIHPENGAFAPKLSEIVYSASLDELIGKNAIPAPTVIKIDVDGNEQKILTGMSRLLAGPNKPRSMQVEVNPGQKKDVTTFLSNFGYRIDHSHYTADGGMKKAGGASEDDIAHNVVYVV